MRQVYQSIGEIREIEIVNTLMNKGYKIDRIKIDNPHFYNLEYGPLLCFIPKRDDISLIELLIMSGGNDENEKIFLHIQPFFKKVEIENHSKIPALPDAKKG